MELKEFQLEFLRAILTGEEAMLAGEVLPPEHLAIYRNNVFAAMENALALTYPSIVKLVGKEFFAQASAAFARTHPPRSGNLDDFGGEFAEFLRHYAPAASVPYLPDMVRFEWRIHEAALAGAGTSIDSSVLAAIPPEKYFNLKLHLHPSARLMESPYPLHKIREFCEQDGTGELDLAEETGCRLLIVRPYRTVDIHLLHRPDHAFLSAVAAGESMYDAYEAAAREDDGFDLAAFIRQQLGYGTFGGFSLGL